MTVKNTPRQREHKAAMSLAKKFLKHPTLKKHLTRRHPRMNVSIVIEEDQKKEVYDVTQERNKTNENNWNPEEALKILDELFGKGLELNEDPKELLDIADRNYKWRKNDGE
jgi:hypothetical protein